MDKSTRKKIQNIHHALSAAVSSINLAKRLLNELESVGTPSSRELPGEFGVFDGYFMVTESGQKYQVPENYASKSKLAFGDRLKRIIRDGEERFKQVERVKRQEIEGILVKKDGKWHVVDSHGSYEVLPAAVDFFGAKEGDEVKAIIPQDDPHATFAALEGLVEKGEAKEALLVEEKEEEGGVEKGEGEKGEKGEKSPRRKKPAKTKRKAEKVKEKISSKEAAPEEELR